jgi:hypothetical protein
VQRKVDGKEELELQRVHLAQRHAAHLGVVGVVEVLVVEELGRQHHLRESESVRERESETRGGAAARAVGNT